ncbi:MAG: nicotinate-nucleotide--dimethylbenzimidazole phosphoribosyltransferase [Desulfotignum sp.]|nr:nicotinate-nucleotide--dimethylbenzimidazole phosphoribosyltransferase [Desulfotignum sp.]
MPGTTGWWQKGSACFRQRSPPRWCSNFAGGGASVNVIANHAGAVVKAADIGVNYDFDPALPIFHKKVRHGTANFTKEPAMTRDEAIRSIEAGIDIVAELEAQAPVDLLGTGDMGIGNTTPSTAVIAAFSGLPVEKLTGRGTGIDDSALANKIAVIKRGLDLRKPDPTDPLDILSKVGGLEIRGFGRPGSGGCGPGHPR